MANESSAESCYWVTSVEVDLADHTSHRHLLLSATCYWVTMVGLNGYRCADPI